MATNEGNTEMTNTIATARARYAAAIEGTDNAEFLAAKKALVELSTDRALTEGEVAYL